MHRMTGLLGIYLALVAAIIATSAVAQSSVQSSEPDDFKVTLLGTGSPPPNLRRFGPAVLIQAGQETLLIDCGRGATQRVLQVGLKLGQVNRVFLTHLHSDHIIGLPDLWLTGWLEAAYAQRQGPLHVHGPLGTKTMTDNLERAYEWDVKTRIADQNLKPANVAFATTEIREGVVYEANGVKVTAFEVNHGELIKPAFGYRVDYDGRSVAISGDTKFDENLIKHASGVDLLIHQVAAGSDELLKLTIFKAIFAHHTSPEEAGVVFTRTKPKLAVFYHFVLLGTPQIPALTERDVLERARKTYSGPMVVGEDLMSFRIGRGAVAQSGPPAR